MKKSIISYYSQEKYMKKQDNIENVSSSCKIVRLTLGEFENFDKRKII